MADGEAVDAVNRWKGAMTVGSMALSFCGQEGIWDAFRAWVIARSVDLGDSSTALWLTDMRQEYLGAFAADFAMAVLTGRPPFSGEPPFSQQGGDQDGP